MIDFSQPYHRSTFLDFLQNGFLPDDFVKETYAIELDSFTPRFAQNVYKLGSSKTLELDVYEVTHTSTHDARVGIAHDAFKLMLNHSYKNRALVVFVPENGNQYRFSLLEIEANQEDNSARIRLSYSNPRRYSFLLGHDAQIKTPNQFLLEKGRLRKVDGSYVKDLQNRFSVEVLTKQFYRELSNWYFWAIQHVTFPGQPTTADAEEKNVKLDELIQEHNATNVIRLLTRLLFVWFIKEKKLIPEELFDIDTLQAHILNGLTPYHEAGLFSEKNRESVFYKAILQNLFFATLNCPIKADKVDKRSRRFRLNNFYGQDFGVDWLYRYEKYFKNPGAFEELMSTIPFLNGGLFECLDSRGEKEKQEERIWVDGFSDNLNKPHQLIVPDYLFFGLEEVADLSDIVGITDKQYKQAAVKGLINILKTYNFTVEENTPAEIQVALDPELLGKVFENLLASYNPETKTTARKQTGSFYTPREIVNYMVDESLMAYLKNKITHWGDLDEEGVDRKLKALFSFNGVSHFEDNPQLQREIINALSTCTILDPACGSGAFPMGALQKMVHILQKLDPQNEIWKEVQLGKAVKESEAAFEIEDRDARRKYLLEIESAFDKTLNDPDYARKLYLIENCIYGVDIQPIATQISKLRFFISLVVDQKSSSNAHDNYGIRALPNLETKFVTANTLIGVSKPDAQLNLFDTAELQELETQLKRVRSKLFNARDKVTKHKYRQQDRELRVAIADEMVKLGYPNQSAQMLAQWDPYDQNASSPFFDPEWMFDIAQGFDIVIGNPPYGATSNPNEKNYYRSKYITAKTIKGVQKGSLDTYTLFIEAGYNSCSTYGSLNYIVPISVTSSDSLTGVHNLLEKNCSLIKISSYAVRPEPIFENAVVNTSIIHFIKDLKPAEKVLATKMYRKKGEIDLMHLVDNLKFINVLDVKLRGRYPKISEPIEKDILTKILNQGSTVGDLIKSKGKPIYYRTSGGRYFKVMTNYATGSTKEKSIYFNSKFSDTIGAILSSNLYFWYYQIISNNLDLKSYEVETFGIPLAKLTDNLISKLEKLYTEYLIDIEENANIRETTRYANISSFKEYKIGKSKQIIDRIDDVIGPLYGLTKEEIDFIKNYEINFRLNEHDE